jgi:hypothetical protein
VKSEKWRNAEFHAAPGSKVILHFAFLIGPHCAMDVSQSLGSHFVRL